MAIGKNGTLFIANIQKGILRSGDNGTTWEYVLEEGVLFRQLGNHQEQ